MYLHIPVDKNFSNLKVEIIYLNSSFFFFERATAFLHHFKKTAQKRTVALIGPPEPGQEVLGAPKVRRNCSDQCVGVSPDSRERGGKEKE